MTTHIVDMSHLTQYDQPHLSMGWDAISPRPISTRRVDFGRVAISPNGDFRGFGVKNEWKTGPFLEGRGPQKQVPCIYRSDGHIWDHLWPDLWRSRAKMGQNGIKRCFGGQISRSKQVMGDRNPWSHGNAELISTSETLEIDILTPETSKNDPKSMKMAKNG